MRLISLVTISTQFSTCDYIDSSMTKLCVSVFILSSFLLTNVQPHMGRSAEKNEISVDENREKNAKKESVEYGKTSPGKSILKKNMRKRVKKKLIRFRQCLRTSKTQQMKQKHCDE